LFVAGQPRENQGIRVEIVFACGAVKGTGRYHDRGGVQATAEFGADRQMLNLSSAMRR
jgi:predicted GH43/DUF377 family glycosyl hydrolase